MAVAQVIGAYSKAKMEIEHGGQGDLFAMGAIYNAGRVAGIRHERARRKSVTPAAQSNTTSVSRLELSDDESDDEIVARMLKMSPESFRLAKDIREATNGLSEKQTASFFEIMMFIVGVATMQIHLADKDITVLAHEKYSATGILSPNQCEDLISTCIKIRDLTAAQREAV